MDLTANKSKHFHLLKGRITYTSLLHRDNPKALNPQKSRTLKTASQPSKGFNLHATIPRRVLTEVPTTVPALDLPYEPALVSSEKCVFRCIIPGEGLQLFGLWEAWGLGLRKSYAAEYVAIVLRVVGPRFFLRLALPT